MAEYSKQFKEAFDFDWHDFDYVEKFNKLEKNQSISFICEGLGTYAVARSNEDTMLLGIESPDNPDMVIWRSLADVIKITKQNLLKNI